MGIKKSGEITDLVMGVTEVVAGSGTFLLGTVMAIKFKGHVAESMIMTYPLGTTLIGNGISRIQKYRREHRNNYDPEMCEFHYLPNYTAWDNIPDKTFDIE